MTEPPTIDYQLISSLRRGKKGYLARMTLNEWHEYLKKQRAEDKKQMRLELAKHKILYERDNQAATDSGTDNSDSKRE
jgi:hypothetical protein